MIVFQKVGQIQALSSFYKPAVFASRKGRPLKIVSHIVRKHDRCCQKVFECTHLKQCFNTFTSFEN